MNEPEASLVGRSLPRREDARFLTGQGSYVADGTAGAYHVAFVRSREAAAEILGIDADQALAVPGVVGVYTAADLGLAMNRIEVLTRPSPEFAEAAGFEMFPQEIYVLAEDHVTYVGQPIAAVIAQDRYTAEDGAELVHVRYAARPAVVDPEAALTPGSPRVHPGTADNEAGRIAIEFGPAELPPDAVTVEGRYRMGRHGAVPMETRGVHAWYDPQRDRLEVRTSTQIPHMVRQAVCGALGVGADTVRVAVPDVGGGFGSKANVYAEEVVLAALARATGHPVAWIEDRQENLTAAAQGRDQVHDARLSVDPQGRILRWEDDFVVDIGSGSLWVGGIVANTGIHLLGPYRVPAARIRGRAAMTNKCIVAQYRGAGRPEASFALERSLDAAAAAVGLTPEEIRRRNLLRAEDMPYERPLPYRDGVPIAYDGGDYVACLDAVLELLPRAQVAAYAAAHPDLEIGYGLASYIEATGRGPWEAARVRLDPGGGFVVVTGAASAGMSHETSFAQVAADALEVPFGQVRYARADTDLLEFGVGSFASRSAVLAGSAVHLAGRELLTRAAGVVALLTGAPAESVTYAAGTFQAPDREYTWAELAAALGPGGAGERLATQLDVTHVFRPRTVTWTMGVHAAVVGIQPASGVVRVLDYAVAHEGGAEINPVVVAGQVSGGVAQGIGGALTEEFAYGPDGQPLSTTFLSYQVPAMGEVPRVRIRHLAVETPENPIGVRGAGESGTIAAYAAVASAVDDAVGDGFHVRSTPVATADVRRAVRARSRA
ncbi:xanthine dehydrogenase family protein molybdopterin-binding subunit [Georgenia sp. SYP-B2076]|uniref:xanthine dehydrogenase family protein molybdopterin-binding subunit n=1 Tax=Georgenia sp. SYP-B2076 TaxID=2495881 RepID=UPI000F8E3AF7|nr:xanthine dehydrogenase family protein molybdopterin-binding subunit [Georgenia sp. SYP-B2076]